MDHQYRDASQALRSLGITAEFGIGYVDMESQRWVEGSYREFYQKLKDLFVQGKTEQRKQNNKQKMMQSELWVNQENDSHMTEN